MTIAMKKNKETQKKEARQQPAWTPPEPKIKFDMSGPWTPEKKAEFRKLMPKKLNKLGESFFSEDWEKWDLGTIVDRKAVLG